MSQKEFSDSERYAVYTVHGERCYMCREPVDLSSMQVDHVIPEHLLDEPEKLASILKAFGLPEDFDLNSYANWLPACGPCNNRKRGRVFNPTPLIQNELQIAAEKAGKAAALASETVSTQKVSRALNTLLRTHEAGGLANIIVEKLRPLVEFHTSRREPELSGLPVRLTPLIEVISEANGLRVVRGPYGVGGGPVGPDIDGSFYCPTCGHVAWNGARCVVCGEMSDD